MTDPRADWRCSRCNQPIDFVHTSLVTVRACLSCNQEQKPEAPPVARDTLQEKR